jgi:hypothetical protein
VGYGSLAAKVDTTLVILRRRARQKAGYAEILRWGRSRAVNHHRRRPREKIRASSPFAGEHYPRAK